MSPHSVVARIRLVGARIAELFQKDRRDGELREELESHLEMATAENVRRGMPPDEARRHARIASGGMTTAAETYREQRSIPSVERLGQDLRYGARMLRRSPSFAVIAIVAVGIAIGINAGFFTLIDAFFWRPLPVANPERLVRFMTVNAEGLGNSRFSYSDYLTIARHSRTVEDVLAWKSEQVAVRPTTHVTKAIPASVGIVSGNFLQALGGGNALLGRALRPSDDDVAAPPVVVVGEGFWRATLAGAPDVVGSDMVINGVHVTIVGVARGSFIGINPLVPDIWMPIVLGDRVQATSGRLLDPKNRFLIMFARLRPGVMLTRAEAELSGLIAEPPAPVDTKEARTRITGVALRPNMSAIHLDGQMATMVAPAFLLVALVLVIACANLGNLLLARALVRQREIAVRLALGASRARVVRQLLTESLLVAILGAGLGLLLSHLTVTIAGRAFFSNFPMTYGTIAFELTTSWRVVGYTVALGFVSVMLFGLAPALQGTSPVLSSALKGEDAVFGTRIKRSRLRNGLVAVQVAACVVLLVAAATLIRSLGSFSAGSTGLAAQRVLVANIGLVSNQTPALAESRSRFAARVAALPDVATARAEEPPYTSWRLLPVAAAPLAGDTVRAPLMALPHNVVTTRYFEVVGQPIVEGRAFVSADSASSAPVAIVTRAAAHKLWPNATPVGQMLRVALSSDGAERLYRVVGVAADAHSMMVWDRDPDGYVFLPATQAMFADLEMPLLVQTRGEVSDLARQLADIAPQVDPDAPLKAISLLDDYALQLLPFQYGAAVVSAIGVLGLALAVVGLYGVVAFSVTQRQRELAVRVAMGATARDILRAVIQREMRLVLVGLGVGLVLAVGEAKLIESIVVAVTALPLGGFVLVTVSLLVVTLAATLVPGARALRISPMQTLRHE